MSELAFFAVIFNNAIFNQKQAKKKVLLLGGLGGGAQDLAAHQILKHFESQIDIVKAQSYYKLLDEDLTQYDFIISSVPIHKDITIPYINVSLIITQEDIDKINNFLYYQYHKNILHNTLLPQLFGCSHARNKNELSKDFYKILKKQFPQIRESITEHLKSQDYHTLTLFPHQVALIRLKKSINNNNIIATLILNKSIMINKHQVKMVILFSCIDHHRYIYNTLLNTLTSLTACKEDLSIIYEKQKYTDFLKYLLKHEKTIG